MERAYRIPESIAARDGPPTCVISGWHTLPCNLRLHLPWHLSCRCISVEDAADYNVEDGRSESAERSWERRPLRWVVFTGCARKAIHTSSSELGAALGEIVEITGSVPAYNASGTPLLRLAKLPRDGSLLLLQYTVPRNVDPYAQLKSFKKFSLHSGDDAEARARRVAAATKFVIFARARSASTTFVTALNLHPNVSCGCARGRAL